MTKLKMIGDPGTLFRGKDGRRHICQTCASRHEKGG